MKKVKKIKKSELKEVSKKELKKKSLGEIKKKSKVLPPDLSDENDFDIKALRDEMAQSSSLYQSLLVQPRNFGEDTLLYPSEIKALKIIGQFPLINLTQLANKLTISKSAVSKCSRKLLDKNLITKEKSQTNIREVVFLLTDSGNSIYDQLDHYQKELLDPFDVTLSQFSKADLILFSALFSKLSIELKKSHIEIPS